LIVTVMLAYELTM